MLQCGACRIFAAIPSGSATRRYLRRRLRRASESGRYGLEDGGWQPTIDPSSSIFHPQTKGRRSYRTAAFRLPSLTLLLDPGQALGCDTIAGVKGQHILECSLLVVDIFYSAAQPDPGLDIFL